MICVCTSHWLCFSGEFWHTGTLANRGRDVKNEDPFLPLRWGSTGGRPGWQKSSRRGLTGYHLIIYSCGWGSPTPHPTLWAICWAIFLLGTILSLFLDLIPTGSLSSLKARSAGQGLAQKGAQFISYTWEGPLRSSWKGQASSPFIKLLTQCSQAVPQ